MGWRWRWPDRLNRAGVSRIGRKASGIEEERITVSCSTLAVARTLARTGNVMRRRTMAESGSDASKALFWNDLISEITLIGRHIHRSLRVRGRAMRRCGGAWWPLVGPGCEVAGELSTAPRAPLAVSITGPRALFQRVSSRQGNKMYVCHTPDTDRVAWRGSRTQLSYAPQRTGPLCHSALRGVMFNQ